MDVFLQGGTGGYDIATAARRLDFPVVGVDLCFHLYVAQAAQKGARSLVSRRLNSNPAGAPAAGPSYHVNARGGQCARRSMRELAVCICGASVQTECP